MYELGKDFRNEGLSTKHNPEFTMVEWYEAYADYRSAAERLRRRSSARPRAVGYDGELDFAAPWRRVTFFEAVPRPPVSTCGADRDAAALARRSARAGWTLKTEGAGWAQMADDLLSKYVEPTLQQPTFVLDYPVELSPFAACPPLSEPGLVERWEAFAGGMEIANAFSELTDPDVQRERFEAQQRLEQAGDEESQPYDEAVRGGARAGNAARRGRGPWDRSPGDAADGPRLDPRGRPVSRDCAAKRPALRG